MQGPISPKDLGKMQEIGIPQEVFNVVNKAIAANWTGTSAIIKQEDILLSVMLALDVASDDRRAVFDNGWLNFEEAYRDRGWVVIYDKPAYNESYRPHWTFRVKK